MKKRFNDVLRKSFLVGLFLMLMGIQHSYAQQTVTGTVTDENSQPVPGANILVKGTTNGTQSDFDGNFNISASSSDVLVISYLGYATQSINVGNQTTISVQLVEDASQLEEVVVIGYGTAKKSDLTGAVSQVTAKSFENQPLTRIEDALQGRAAGVTVSNSGAPGAGIKVRVRGVNSITGNNDPLVVVDGVFGGDLRTINPNNIQSMEVLKDASALAIYGSRGSNGVILVTTKKGSGKTKISLDQFVTVGVSPKHINTISSAEFARQKTQDEIAAGNTIVSGVTGYTDADIASLEANPINYQDLIFQTGITNNTQLSLSGSNEDFRYFVSGNYINQEGTIIRTGYERYSMRANLSASVNDRLTIGTNISASREINVNDPNVFDRSKGGLLVKALTWDPTSPVRDANGEYILRSPQEYGNNNFNPIAVVERSNTERIADRLNLTINAKYKLTDNFSYNLILGTTTLNQKTESIRIERNPAPGNTGFGNISFNNQRNTFHQVSNVLNWNKSFNKHNLDLTGVYEFQGSKNLTNLYKTTDLNVTSIYLADNESVLREDFENRGSESAIQSYLGRAQYNFNQSLYLTGSIRVDESSKFAKGNRTGYFPSAAVAYNFGNLPFIENGEILSSLKVRAGWGEVGNENIGATAALTLTEDGSTSAYSFNGSNLTPGSTLFQIGNEDLTWETTAQTNVGLDFGFLNGRINASVDYFKKNTTDLLIRTQLPGTTYFQFKNAGEVNNTGIDFTISANIIQNDNFSWDANFNLSHIKNEVVELADDVERIEGNIQPIDGTTNVINAIQKGEPLGTFYGYTYLGTWKTSETAEAALVGSAPGDAKYLRDDETGERVLGAIGNGLPTLTWGLNNTFRYKNWDLNIFVNAASGFDVYNLVEGAINGGTGAFKDNLSPNTFNEWTPENETDIPASSGKNKFLNSSRWVEDGSFIRLSNLKLGYTFGKIAGIQSLQLYGSAQNVFIITNYKGYDPEVSSTPITTNNNPNNADAGAGINIGAYPNPRTFTLGVKATF